MTRFCLLTFQFHKGSIRTNQSIKEVTESDMFQFHKGSIRTFLQRNAAKGALSFNSIKVQLEHFTGAHTRPLAVFQFHKGSIRTLCAL